MTDLSQMSDADLMAALQARPDVGSMVANEARTQGVDPALALGVWRAEGANDGPVLSPKGAIGPMQLMPGTAQDLGVDPHDLAQNVHGGVKYLKQQLDTFGGDRKLAAAAYNAGPGAVQQHGGVPPFPETQAYVDKVIGGTDPSKLSDAELMAALGPDAAPPAPQAAAAPPAAAAPIGPVVVMNPETGNPYNGAQQHAYAGMIARGELDPSAMPGSEKFPRGLVDVNDTPNPGAWFVDLNGVKRQAPGANYGRDAIEGFTAPIESAGHDFMQAYRNTNAGKASLADAPRLLADVATTVPAAILGAVTRPAADAAAQALPTPYRAPRLQMQDGQPVLTAARALHGSEALDATQNAIETALSGARAEIPSGVAMGRPLPLAKPMSLDELKAAKKAAYAKVDQSGFRFPQPQVQALANDIAAEVATKGGPSGARIYPAGTAMADRITELAAQPDGVPLTQLDSLRSDIYDALIKPGDREAPIGAMMRQKIDGLINASDAPDIQEARDLNTRYSKAQAITDKLDSADLRSSSTYSGGNYQNAVRQSLRPLVDPTSGQQVRNLTQAEKMALRRTVKGTAGQNATRYASKFLTNRFVQVPASLMTHGIATPVMEAAGAVLNKAGEKQTDAAVQKVLDLIASGGNGPAAGPPPLITDSAHPWGQFFDGDLPPIVPPISLLSPRGAVGASVVARPLAPSPSGANYGRPRRGLLAGAR